MRHHADRVHRVIGSPGRREHFVILIDAQLVHSVAQPLEPTHSGAE